MKENNTNIELIKVIACIGVVLLHTIGLKSSNFNNVIYYLGTISVPLFFMINGYLVLNKNEITYKYLFKKIVRLLFIALIWNIIYSGILTIIQGKMDNPFIQTIKSLLEKGNMFWFWFLGALIILYLLTPILHKILNKPKVNKIFILLCVLLCEIIYIVNIYRGYNDDTIIKKIVPQTLRIWTWITYFYMGGFIKNNIRWKKEYNFLVFILTIICLPYEFLISHNVLHNLYAENFYDSILIMFWIFMTFNFLLNMKIRESFEESIIHFGKLTLGIYIIHVCFIKIINIYYDFYNPIINVFIFFSVLCISYITSNIIKKIKYLDKIIT